LSAGRNELMVKAQASPRQCGMWQVVAETRAVHGGGGALVRRDTPVFRALRCSLRNRIGQRNRQFRSERGIERSGIDRAGRANAAAELQAGGSERGGLVTISDLRRVECEA